MSTRHVPADRLRLPTAQRRARSAGVAAAAIVASAAVATGCGGKAVVDGSSAGGAGGSSSTATWTTRTTSTATTTTWTTATGTGHPNLEITVTGTEVGLDCMPEVAPDPLYASFEVTYDNVAGTAPFDAVLVSPTVVLGEGASALSWTFAVTPPSSGPVAAGQLVTVRHEKVAGSGSGDTPLGPCSYCGASALLEVTADDGVSLVTASESFGPVLCAY